MNNVIADLAFSKKGSFELDRKVFEIISNDESYAHIFGIPKYTRNINEIRKFLNKMFPEATYTIMSSDRVAEVTMTIGELSVFARVYNSYSNGLDLLTLAFNIVAVKFFLGVK